MRRGLGLPPARDRARSVAKPMSAACHSARGTLPREPRSHEQFSTVVALPSCLRRLLEAKTHVERNVIIDVDEQGAKFFSLPTDTHLRLTRRMRRQTTSTFSG